MDREAPSPPSELDYRRLDLPDKTLRTSDGDILCTLTRGYIAIREPTNRGCHLIWSLEITCVPRDKFFRIDKDAVPFTFWFWKRPEGWFHTQNVRDGFDVFCGQPVFVDPRVPYEDPEFGPRSLYDETQYVDYSIGSGPFNYCQ